MHLQVRFEHIWCTGAESWLEIPHTGRRKCLIKGESWTWASVKSSGFNMIRRTDHISCKIKAHLLACNKAQSRRGSGGSCWSIYANVLSLTSLRGHGWASDLFIQTQLTHSSTAGRKAKPFTTVKIRNENTTCFYSSLKLETLPNFICGSATIYQVHFSKCALTNSPKVFK